MTQRSSDPVIDKIVRSLDQNSADFAQANRRRFIASVLNRIARIFSLTLVAWPLSRR